MHYNWLAKQDGLTLPSDMGRLLSNQESNPIERSKFNRGEIETADEARVPYEGWVEIEDVVMTDKGTVITFEREKNHGTLEDTTSVDNIRALR